MCNTYFPCHYGEWGFWFILWLISCPFVRILVCGARQEHNRLSLHVSCSAHLLCVDVSSTVCHVYNQDFFSCKFIRNGNEPSLNWVFSYPDLTYLINGFFLCPAQTHPPGPASPPIFGPKSWANQKKRNWIEAQIHFCLDSSPMMCRFMPI